MGPITVFDKSALQALSLDEAVWFDNLLLPNLVPIFYVETLADLGKEVEAGRSPEDVVGMLAAKTPYSAGANVHHRTLILGDLMGREISMRGQIVTGAGELKLNAEGKLRLHIDEFPEQAAMVRWQDGDFLEIERSLAQQWRIELAEHDPAVMIALVENILPEERVSNAEQLKGFIDRFCATDDGHVLDLLFEVLRVPEDFRAACRARWEACSQPQLDSFMPFAVHVFKVDLLFYLGIHRGFISGERASNRADMAYLYYLPFANAFTSGDKLHRRVAPLFMRDDQSFVDAQELKKALAECDRCFSEMPDETKARGVLAFAACPPPELDNALARLWDRHMRSDWREMAADREATLKQPRDIAKDAESIEGLERTLEGAQPAAPSPGSNDPSYMAIRRRMPARMGKWRIVPEEAEEGPGG